MKAPKVLDLEPESAVAGAFDGGVGEVPAGTSGVEQAAVWDEQLDRAAQDMAALELPARLWTGLVDAGDPWAVVTRSGAGAVAVVTTSLPAARVAQEAGCAVWLGKELGPLTLAAEHGRAYAADWDRWCGLKTRQAAMGGRWDLQRTKAIGGVAEPLEPRGWSLGQVFRVLEVEVLAVGSGDECADVVRRAVEGRPTQTEV